MPEQNEKNLPKAPAFNPKVKETIAAFKENNNPRAASRDQILALLEANFEA